jgi:hypothetical protein
VGFISERELNHEWCVWVAATRLVGGQRYSNARGLKPSKNLNCSFVAIELRLKAIKFGLCYQTWFCFCKEHGAIQL